MKQLDNNLLPAVLVTVALSLFLACISLSLNSCEDRDQATKIAEIQTRIAPKPLRTATPSR